MLTRKPIPGVEMMTCVDITAGQKPFSVAAATYTFNRGFQIIYNPSGKESHGLLSDDVQIDFGTFAGL